MKVISYRILVFSDIFLLMDENRLRKIGEIVAKVLDDNLSSYYHIDWDKSPSFGYLSLRIFRTIDFK